MKELEKVVVDGISESLPNVTSGTYDQRSFYQKAKDAATNYLVDVSSGWIFFTPLYAAMEYFAFDGDFEKIKRSRGAALVAHAIAMRPTGKLRNYFAKKWNVNKKSPFKKRLAVNVTAGTPIQALLYTGALLYSGASINEFLVALPTGLAIGAPLFEPFGLWMDKWRKIWGKEQAIK